MARQSKIRPAPCGALSVDDVQMLTGFYSRPSVRSKVTVYNLSSYPISYLDDRFGVIHCVRLPGEHGRRKGVSVVVTLEVPSSFQSGALGAGMNELINAAVAQGGVESDGNTIVYTYGFEIPDHLLLNGVIYKDNATGVMVGVGECDWPAAGGNVLGDFAGRSSAFRGRLQAIEFVDDHRECVYLVGVKNIDPISSIPTHVAGKQPGLYITSLNEMGELTVKSYSTCELCRADENFAVFERFSEAEAFQERSGPTSTKKGAAAPGQTLSERLKSRAERDTQRPLQPNTSRPASGPSGGAQRPNSSAGPAPTGGSFYDRIIDGTFRWFERIKHDIDENGLTTGNVVGSLLALVGTATLVVSIAIATKTFNHFVKAGG